MGARPLNTSTGAGPSAAETNNNGVGRASVTAAQRQALAALESGWTATMAEKLLDMCFRIFFKFGDATLSLLPEVLGLHQVGTGQTRIGGSGFRGWREGGIVRLGLSLDCGVLLG